MATVSWRESSSGNWSTALNWSDFHVPTAADSIVLGGSGPYAVTVDVASSAQDVTMSAVGATLDVAVSLALAGVLSVGSASTLILSGTIVGGTIDAPGGVVGAFGTLDGTALTAGTGIADVTITAATAAANVGGTIRVGESVALAGGTYGTTSLLMDLTSGGGGSLGTAGTASVTFAADTTVSLFQDTASLTAPVAGQSAAFTGAGSMLNLGTITSNESNAAGGTLAISVAGFSNAGVLNFAPLLLAEKGTFVTGYEQFGHGTVAVQGELDWTQGYGATLEISSASFANAGAFSVAGGTLNLMGATFTNTGTITLNDVMAQMVTSDTQGVASVIDVTLGTRIEIGATTTFDNTGIINADTIVFDGAMTLAALGTLSGAVDFAGGLDLGGGTLDAAQFTSVTLSGLVQNGSIGAGTVALNGATLDNVALAPGGAVTIGGPITLVDPPASAGPVTLDAVTTELQFSAGITSDIAVVAGDALTTDLIRVADIGTVTFGPAFTLTDTVVGSTVELGGFGTLVNQGTITLDGATLLVATTLDGGGTIVAADNAAVTLEALAVTATPTISFGAGSTLLTLPGTGALGVTFVGLHDGDVVDFTSISSVPNGQFGAGGAVQQGGTLFLTGASGEGASIASSDAPDGLLVLVREDGSGGTLLVVACFAQGTAIATAEGERPVERLQPGDVLRTWGGRLAPVRWVGHTRVDLARHPQPERAAPIRVRAGAFGEGVPTRDLLVSPEHCFLIDGAMVPAFLLVNGATIARQDGLAEITYWHVELDRHDVLLAEGAPAESYLDTGNRSLFAGEAGVRALHPDLAGPTDAAALRVWRRQGCAPLRLEADDVRAGLRGRAGALGWTHSAMPALAVLAHGRRLKLDRTHTSARLRVPAGTTRLTLLSDSFVPAEMQPGSGDMRRLGIAVSSVRLAGWDLHPDALAEGWHESRAEPWRWSDGAASITLPRLARATELEIGLVDAGRYWRAPAAGGSMNRFDGASIAVA